MDPKAIEGWGRSPPWITLLTDFGPKDSYIGIMKGVIATIAPHAMVVDLSHGVAPQDVLDGAFLLATSYTYFPAGTIHVAVVDPGVGGRRPILAVEFKGHIFVAPDNGLLSGVFAGVAPERVFRVEEGRFFLPTISGTFHGRDIFAPVAAHLAKGLDLASLGPPHDVPVVSLWRAPAVSLDGVVRGEVIYCDHFGNAVTNIALPEEGAAGAAHAAGCELPLLHHYSQVAIGEPLALRGSSGYLEVAIRQGNACDQLKLKRGALVEWRPGARAPASGSGPVRGEPTRPSRARPQPREREKAVAGTDRYRRMFGEVALELGFVTAAQLYDALTLQAKRKAEGKPDKLLGQLLLELGYMDTAQVKHVIDVLYPVVETD